MEDPERRLLAEIDPDSDCLRLYRMADTKGCEVRQHGTFRSIDFDDPLVL